MNILKSKIIELVVVVVIGISACEGPRIKEPIDLSELTVSEIHRAYRNGTYNGRQLVQTYLERIERLDSLINAVTVINPNALSIAEALDEEYQKTGVLRPLHGIPIIVKDNFNTKGLPTTAGSLALKDFIPEEDAFIIEKLVKAGAIIIAKSNMAEWAFTPWGSFSSTHGSTLNAYNLNYTSAGSSGGSGASIAANFGVIGLGTDTGGSIRLPSSHGSLVGFRPTLGLVSRAGIIPVNLGNDIAGPMCRTVEDATRTLEIIAGYDENDLITKYSEGKIPENYTQFLEKEGLTGARIGILREISESTPDPGISSLFERAVHDMKLMGAIMIDSVKIPNFSELRKNLWCNDFRSDLESYLNTYVKNDTVKTVEDIMRIGTKSAFTEKQFNFLVNNLGRNGNTEINCLDTYTDSIRIAFRKAIEDHMDGLKLDALIYPSWNIRPYKIDSIVEEYIGDNTGVIAPHTGQPAFSVPMGFMEGNLPTGLEFLGRMYSEPTLIKLAYSYEQGTKHRRSTDLEKAIIE